MNSPQSYIDVVGVEGNSNEQENVTFDQLYVQVQALYERLENDSSSLDNHLFLFSDKERVAIVTCQDQILNYQRMFLNVSEQLSGQTDDAIGRGYLALRRMGRSALAEVSKYHLRVGDYLEADNVGRRLEEYQQSHRGSLRNEDIVAIAQYRASLDALVDDFQSGKIADGAMSAFRQLAKGGVRLMAIIEERHDQWRAKLIPRRVVVTPPTATPMGTYVPSVDHAEPSPGLWSSTPEQPHAVLDHVDTSSFEPVAEHLEEEDSAAISMPAADELSVVSTEIPAFPVDGPPAPTEFTMQGPSEVELVLAQRALSNRLEEAHMALNRALSAVKIQETGGTVRRWVRSFLGKDEADRKAHFDSRKEVVACQQLVNELAPQLAELETKLSNIRAEKAAHRSPEFLLEPRRVELASQVGSFEKELRTLKAGLEAATPRERIEWTNLFVDRQKAYRKCLADLAAVETQIFGRPLDRINSKLLTYEPGGASRANNQPLTTENASVPIESRQKVHSPVISSAPVSPASLSPTSGGVLLSPHVPEWDELRALPMEERIRSSRMLQDAVKAIPARLVSSDAIGGKAWAERPQKKLEPLQVPTTPAAVVPPSFIARDTLLAIDPSRLIKLGERDPVTRDVVVKGMASARNHLGVKPLDFDEYASLSARIDVLPAMIAHIEDEIAAAPVPPTGFLARAKRALFGDPKHEARVGALTAQLAQLQAEEIKARARFKELEQQRQVA